MQATRLGVSAGARGDKEGGHCAGNKVTDVGEGVGGCRSSIVGAYSSMKKSN